MDTTEPTIDAAHAARTLIGWIENPAVGPLGLGYALDLWLAITGHPLDPDDPDYEDGMQQAMAQAYALAYPEPAPAAPVVTDVEIVRGEVL